ncbi:N-acyl-D-amino-acid deacylase family protein [Pseudemcibacter aquimaris]|uniref:N-acyl-D-amino-acid deacylase family protein n=1 Tax=Pseudemcibacter aquimaris TaxID=2857064 RepID=UPI002011B739|nr:D-aminoacylase [Pseudemcibacter aquimaris]MCC3859928.1 D-aminoacylase [Pseudemcibacter aquimaris]WDU57260.1 D-aminoacylase [Pseudemcibacter aquimaris]
MNISPLRHLLFNFILLFIYSCSVHVDKQSELPGTVTLIKNAFIYNGTGDKSYFADVRIEGGLIKKIGDITANENDIIWDANGLALAPGFIDPHSHHDTKLMNKPAPESALAQGITTIVSGLDGGASTFGSPFISIDHSFSVFEKTPAAINLAYFAPHDTYREIVMGNDFKRLATADELDQMKIMLRRDMEAGALGLSTGLEYEPSLYSNSHEVIELAKVAAEYGGKYSSHIRSEDIKVTEAIDEVITIAREADISANISHIKLAMYEIHGNAPTVIDKLDNARKSGLNITADIYPYDGWKAPMAILMPARNYEDREAAEYALNSIASPSSITISDYEGEPTYIGKTLSELAIEKNKDPVDLMMELLQRAERENLHERVIGRNIGDADIEAFMKWPFTAITTDGGIDDSHPRGQGAFARVLARYVRDKKVISLSEAIRKMTSLPASNLGITDRGLIKKGYAADLVLFNPATIQDNASFENSLQYSSGIAAVWVNGELVWNKDVVTDARPGKIIRRQNINN